MAMDMPSREMTLAEWVERLPTEHRARRELATLQGDVEAMQDGLQRIVAWSEAYPLDVFPEPDFKKAHEVLTAVGMTLDAISASNMRHVVEGVGQIAREALAAAQKQDQPAP